MTATSAPVSDSPKLWHALGIDTVAKSLGSDADAGLTQQEAGRRLDEFGPNALADSARTPWYVVFCRQFASVLILILAAAAGIAIAIGEIGDAMTVAAIVLLNGILGFVQEWRAEKAHRALKQMLSPECKAVREGREAVIDSRDLVPGDLVSLGVGDRVPADLRLIASRNLEIDESALTGESVSVAKSLEQVASDAPLAARTSMAWTGTAVTSGRGQGLVVATAMATEFGRIAQLTQEVGDETTPLQRKLGVLGRQLGVFSIAISIMIALTGWLLGRDLFEMFLTGVSLAVAVVPEGLPAVVTITLAMGIRSMVRRQVLLRRLQAAEALGAAEVVCTDKTGTLTEGRMTVDRVWLAAGALDVTGVGYAPVGAFRDRMGEIAPDTRRDLLAMLGTAAVCNRARLREDEEGWHAVGDPTEAALIVAVRKAGIDIELLPPIIDEFPFDSSRKRMSVITEDGVSRTLHVKGAPEVILERCTRILDGTDERALSPEDRKTVLEIQKELAQGGLRTLAMARRFLGPGPTPPGDQTETNLTLLGLVGIIDPPRVEVASAVRTATDAGVKAVMITGDAAPTAQSIARQVGLPDARAVTGQELALMGESQLNEEIEAGTVFARTTPEDKLRIVRLLQERGYIVGMTGDGVNDAPALKQADIAIAMGIRGTDVAKGVSDIVLTDDNFSSIISGVEEGRRQYDNIQKFVRYLLSSNVGEVVAILFNILLGGPLILLPVQILWMNLVTDGMTAVALGLEPAEKGIMRRPPRPAHEAILDRRGITMIALLGGYIGVATLWLFHHYLDNGGAGAAGVAQTVAFTGIVVLEKVNVFNFRAFGEPLMETGVFSNPWLLLAWGVTVGLQVCAVYVPFLQRMLHTVPLRWEDWALMIAVAAPIFVFTETHKWLRWRSRPKPE